MTAAKVVHLLFISLEAITGLHMIECNDQCFSFVQTLAGNMEGYSKRQIKDAKEALTLLPKLGYPSKQDFINMIRAGSIENCTVLEEDVERMYDIWKADVASMKGKTTRTNPDRVRQSIVALPAGILEKNKIIHLSMDIFFNGNLPFCISLSRDILLNTIQYLTSRKKQDKLDCIKMICQLYYRRGFQVRYIYTDNEFADLTSDLMDMGIYLNVCAANEHVPAIERRISLARRDIDV